MAVSKRHVTVCCYLIRDPESIGNELSQHFTQNKPAHLMFSMSTGHPAS